MFVVEMFWHDEVGRRGLGQHEFSPSSLSAVAGVEEEESTGGGVGWSGGSWEGERATGSREKPGAALYGEVTAHRGRGLRAPVEMAVVATGGGSGIFADLLRVVLV